MKPAVKKLLSVATVVALSGAAIYGCSSSNASQSEQDATVAELIQGNTEFTQGNLAKLTAKSTMAELQKLTTGQKPLTIVLSCSDSRVPPEIIFNKGLGELFVIRVAGNTVDKDQLGSIEYAIEHLKSPVVLMVLGHTKCGAVHATAEAVKANTAIDANSNIGGILAKIKPAVDISFKNYTGLERLVDHAVDENVKIVAEDLKKKSTIIEEAVKAGHVKLAQYKYDIDNGKVTEVK